MNTVKIKNESEYDRKFFGFEVVLDPNKGTNYVDAEKVSLLSKHSEVFRQLSTSEEGEPEIIKGSSTPDGKVKLNCEGLSGTRMFNAPKVVLHANEVTKVKQKFYDKLEKDNRFQSLKDAGYIRVLNEE